ncbi:MAG: hypothetical protein Q9186_001115 [Xanthomendoza sp. 1 TL-2023]
MTSSSPSPTIRICQALGITASSFLAGTLTTISTLAIPSLLSGNPPASILLTQWHTLFALGIKLGPTLALLGCVNYLYVACYSDGRRGWRKFVGAAVGTVGIVP